MHTQESRSAVSVRAAFTLSIYLTSYAARQYDRDSQYNNNRPSVIAFSNIFQIVLLDHEGSGYSYALNRFTSFLCTDTLSDSTYNSLSPGA